MNLNQTLSINPNICTWVFLHNSLHALALPNNVAYVTIHNEGVYIPFPSSALKLSNIHIQFYLLALTTINAFYLLRTRANCSRSIYILQVRFFLMAHLRSRNNFKVISKFVLGTFPTVFRLCVGSLDVGDAPASYSLA
jgi:hypothetical protein